MIIELNFKTKDCRLTVLDEEYNDNDFDLYRGIKNNNFFNEVEFVNSIIRWEHDFEKKQYIIDIKIK